MAFRARSIHVGPRSSCGIRQIGETFVGSEGFGTVDAESIVGIGGFDATVSALVTVFAGFGETTFVHEFPATGHGSTTFERLDFQIQYTDETSIPECQVFGSQPLQTSTVSWFDCGWVMCVFIWDGKGGPRDIFCHVSRGGMGGIPLL